MPDKEIVIKVKQEGGVSLKGGKASGGGGILEYLKGMIGGGATKGMGGIAASLGIAVAAVGVITAAVTAIAAGIAILVASSQFLQKSLGRIAQLFMLLVRPIADIFATLLQPLIWMLMPLVRVMRMIFRPFQQFLREALRSRREQIVDSASSGNIGGVAYLYLEAIGVALSRWFGVIGVDIIETAVMAMIDVLEDLGNVIITAGKDSVLAFIDAVTALGGSLFDMFATVFPFAKKEIMDVKAVFFDSMAKAKETVVTVFEGEGGIRSIFTSGMDDVKATVSSAFDHIRIKANEINAIVGAANDALDSIGGEARGGGQTVSGDFPQPASGTALFSGPSDNTTAGATLIIGDITIHATDADEAKRKLDETIQETLAKLPGGDI